MKVKDLKEQLRSKSSEMKELRDAFRKFRSRHPSHALAKKHKFLQEISDPRVREDKLDELLLKFRMGQIVQTHLMQQRTFRDKVCRLRPESAYRSCGRGHEPHLASRAIEHSVPAYIWDGEFALTAGITVQICATDVFDPQFGRFDKEVAQTGLSQSVAFKVEEKTTTRTQKDEDSIPFPAMLRFSGSLVLGMGLAGLIFLVYDLV